MNSLDDIVAAVTAAKDPYIVTTKGQQFRGTNKDKSRTVTPNLVEVSTKNKSKEDIVKDVAHEAQHMIDLTDRDLYVLQRMYKDYPDVRKLKDYVNHHSELRAFAREFLAAAQEAYFNKSDQSVQEKFPTFESYVEDALRLGKVNFDTGNRQRFLSYIYKFLRDYESGYRLGINNLPSDHWIKNIVKTSKYA